MLAYSQARASVNGLVAIVYRAYRDFCTITNFSLKIDRQRVGFAPLESLVTLVLL